MGHRTAFYLVFWLTLFTPNLLASESDSATFSNYKITQMASGLDSPWAIVQLDKDRFLVNEKVGTMRLVESGIISEPIKKLPQVFARSQGGLMDLQLHPDYSNNHWIYFSYATGDRENNALRVMRAKLKQQQLVEQQVIFTVSPWKDTPVHYGARMTFLPDNSLLITSGDGFDYRESAQKKDSLLGKIVRVSDDGGIPNDNPFINDKAVKPEIWSLGHRNPQGIVYDKKRQQVFSNEHGPQGGDEINVIEKGKNYGWPIVTNGIDYSGALITPFKEYQGMISPLVDWTPSIAPSALTVYYGEMFPELEGDLLTTTLKSKELRRVKLVNGKVEFQQSLLKEIEARLRDVMIDLQGGIILLTDDGRVLRVTRG